MTLLSSLQAELLEATFWIVVPVWSYRIATRLAGFRNVEILTFPVRWPASWIFNFRCLSVWSYIITTKTIGDPEPLGIAISDCTLPATLHCITYGLQHGSVAVGMMLLSNLEAEMRGFVAVIRLLTACLYICVQFWMTPEANDETGEES